MGMIKLLRPKISEYDQEMTHSHTTDQHVTPQGGVA